MRAYTHIFHPVRKTKNPCLIELSDIAVHETENAFKFVTPANNVNCSQNRIPFSHLQYLYTQPACGRPENFFSPLHREGATFTSSPSIASHRIR
ncbi:hypothetical protein BDN72DRAFT_439275 [Pluteus cervinus]|uniref:Uncharacterized protein n=1 Tax=Pluteus cervinus TaxID=181527 RepID=A0ACD3A7C3_9AGAR|nr:hypothetical protein BDN72DRAFT_439275 [Pluteus cervinus]